MRLKFTDELATVLEDIYQAQKRPRLYAWTVELNEQFLFLEARMERADIDLTVIRVRQNCDNLHVTVQGDADRVAQMDAMLIGHSVRKNYKHLLILEHKA